MSSARQAEHSPDRRNFDPTEDEGFIVLNVLVTRAAYKRSCGAVYSFKLTANKVDGVSYGCR